MTWKSLLTGDCLLLNESSTESSCMSFLHYFHAAISNHLSEKPNMFCCIWSLNMGLTVLSNKKHVKAYQKLLREGSVVILMITTFIPLDNYLPIQNYKKKTPDYIIISTGDRFSLLDNNT